MAKRSRKPSASKIERKIKEGDGQGRGIDYKPWCVIQDVPSQGLVTRIKGWKTGRVHHLLSQLELHYFCLLEWSSSVQDIREQYPLQPLDETIAIAQGCGIKHPIHPQTKEPIVMTTDFVITVKGGMATLEQARTVKPAGELQRMRVLEKLEIERRYWAVRGIDWGIVTERELPQPWAKNTAQLHGYLTLADRLSLKEEELMPIVEHLSQLVKVNGCPLRVVTAECDSQLGLVPGTSLTLAYHLLATKRWTVDMNVALNPNHPLTLLALPDQEVIQ